MKNCILFLFLSLFSLPGFSQISQGNVVLSGTVSYRSINEQGFDDNPVSRNISIVPSVGYFVSDQLSLGLGIGYSSSKNKGINVESTTNFFVIVPNGRYYVPIADGTFYFFGEAALSLAFGTTKREEPTVETESDLTVYDISLSPGFAFFPSENWSIDFSFRGIGLNVENPEGDDNNTSTFDFAFDAFSPSLSFSYFFNR